MNHLIICPGSPLVCSMATRRPSCCFIFVSPFRSRLVHPFKYWCVFASPKASASQIDALLQPFMFVSSVLTLLLIAFVWYKAHILSILWSFDERLRSVSFFVVVVSFVVCVSVYAFLSLNVLRGGDTSAALDLNKEYPKSIYAMTLSGTCAFIASVFAFWPIWGWKTPFLIFLHVFGLVMLPNLFTYIL